MIDFSKENNNEPINGDEWDYEPKPHSRMGVNVAWLVFAVIATALFVALASG